MNPRKTHPCCVIGPKSPWVIELHSCEELLVNEVISRVFIVLGLRHRSLVGLRERRRPSEFVFK